MADAVFLAMREAHNASLELSRTGVSVSALGVFRVAQGSESEVWAPYATCARTELAKFYKEMGVPMPGAGGGCSERRVLVMVWPLWPIGIMYELCWFGQVFVATLPNQTKIFLQKVCCCRCSFVVSVKATIM